MNRDYNKFEKLVQTLNEAEEMGGDVVGGPTDPMGGGSGEPTPGISPAGDNEQAGVNLKYNKPYIEIAQIMYKALLQDYSQLSESQVQRLGITSPDEITSDQQAVAVMDRIEKAITDSQGIPVSSPENI
jgi:hypothetical protein